MALLLFASFSSMNFSNLFTLSRICWDEKEVNVMSSLLLFFFFEVGGWVERTQGRKIQNIYLTCDVYLFQQLPFMGTLWLWSNLY